MEEGLRFAGWIGAIDGSALEHTPNFAWGDAIRIRTKREVKFRGGDFVGGILLDPDGESKMSLFAGPSFKNLDQRSNIFSYETTNRTPDQNYMTLGERLQAYYYGIVVGSRLDIPIEGRWTFSAAGDVGVYRLDSKYRGRQRTVLSSANIDTRTDLELDDSRVAMTFRFETSLRVMVHERITVRLGAGIEYLSHTPRVRYGNEGDGFGDNAVHDPARLDYQDAFGLFGALSVGVAF